MLKKKLKVKAIEMCLVMMTLFFGILVNFFENM